jgi:uncharacterized protein YjbI with pentapeptide repeats
MKKLVLITIIVSAAFIWSGIKGKLVIATTGSDTSSIMPATNFAGANLTGANLAGVSLDGVTLCNTTMPDGTINNSSCKD